MSGDDIRYLPSVHVGGITADQATGCFSKLDVGQNQKIGDENCGSSKTVICEYFCPCKLPSNSVLNGIIKRHQLSLLLSKVTCSAPAAYDIQHGKKLYKVEGFIRSYSTALNSCQGDGAQLIMPKTKEEFEFFKTILGELHLIGCITFIKCASLIGTFSWLGGLGRPRGLDCYTQQLC